MRASRVHRIIPLVWLLLVTGIKGQFYSPETEYHDPVQRMFPVEALRVLAWRENQHTNRTAEVSFTVSIATNGTTAWRLSCLDANGKATHIANVEYPSAVLKQGPGFYREVMRQLLFSDWQAIKALPAAKAEAEFWAGAELAGLSREESLTRAFAITSTASNRTDESLAPQLAGLLVHAALPSIGACVSLDNQLLARSAAWLALTERACSNELTQLWSPVLFLAGRERAAAEAWGKTGGKPTVPGAAFTAAWDLWLKHPTTKDAFLFAIDTKNKPIAMAMLAYDSQVNGSGNLLAEVIEPFAGSMRTLASLHNYSVLFAVGSVGSGHIMNGAWPVYQRAAWLDCLAHYSPAVPNEGVDFLPALHQVTNALAQLKWPNDGLDACLHGLRETAPLFRMGQKEGVGRLVPAAVATARDLLNYGWEMTGLQMGARYHFVDHSWGVHEHAKPILERTTSEVQGLYPFFKNAESAHIHNYQECLFRLQHVGGIYRLVGWNPNPFSTNSPASQGSAVVFMKRCWLRAGLFIWQARSLWDENRFDLIAEVVDAIEQEAGALGAIAVLDYLTSIHRDRLGPLPKAREWIADLAKRLPQPTRLYVNALWEREFSTKSELEKAKELERLYWQNPESNMEDWVFLSYARAGAFEAARRFYLESRENLLDPVRTSSSLGHYVYITGYLKNDAKLRGLALEDSASGSYADMLLHVWDAAIRDDRDELKEHVEEIIERYDKARGPNSLSARMKEFLPLLPALADSKNPQHRKAIQYFGNDTGWVVLRWIWIEKFKLSKGDAIVFLGGRETDAARRVLVCYLDGDGEKTSLATDELMHRDDASSEQVIFAKFLSLKLAKDSKEPAVPDLKPPQAISARSAVLARIKEKQK